MSLKGSVFFFFFFRKKDGTIFVDPSPYTINLLIAYDENTFFFFFLFLKKVCVCECVRVIHLSKFVCVFCTSSCPLAYEQRELTKKKWGNMK